MHSNIIIIYLFPSEFNLKILRRLLCNSSTEIQLINLTVLIPHRSLVVHHKLPPLGDDVVVTTAPVRLDFPPLQLNLNKHPMQSITIYLPFASAVTSGTFPGPCNWYRYRPRHRMRSPRHLNFLGSYSFCTCDLRGANSGVFFLLEKMIEDEYLKFDMLYSDFHKQFI